MAHEVHELLKLLPIDDLRWTHLRKMIFQKVFKDALILEEQQLVLTVAGDNALPVADIQKESLTNDYAPNRFTYYYYC